MARTGSGKTAAFLVPMLEKIVAARESAGFAEAATSSVAPRGLVLSPTRELALQTFGVAKGLAKYIDGLELCALVGGEAFETQFAAIARRPDAVVATPGRLLHHVSEYKDGFSLARVDFCCFDEADRLFEMGFAEQINEVLGQLPPTRQVVLCSATMPKALADFAAAGLHPNPHVIRLDAEKRLPPTLTTSFFACTEDTRPAALLLALRAVGVAELAGEGKPGNDDDGAGVDALVQTRMHEATAAAAAAAKAEAAARRAAALEKRRAARGLKKRRSSAGAAAESAELVKRTCIVFCATKHHVEYLHLLLAAEGISSVPLHGSMEQTNRRWAVAQVTKRRVAVLLATDVAARGVDLPLLDVVINYDFPPSPKLFVHRAGRTARAGEPGHCTSLVNREDLSYALDLHLFLGKALSVAPSSPSDVCQRMLKSPEPSGMLAWMQAGNATLGRFPTATIDDAAERVATYADGGSSGSSADSLALAQLGGVVVRALRLYQKTRPKASKESVRRAKLLAAAAVDGGGAARLPTATDDDGAVPPSVVGLHPLALRMFPEAANDGADAAADTTTQTDLLHALRSFKPKVCGMEMISRRMGGRLSNGTQGSASLQNTTAAGAAGLAPGARRSRDPASFADSSFFIPGAGMRGSEPSEFQKEHGGGSSAEIASAVMDLQMDDADQQAKQQRQYHWDAKKRRYIKLRDGETIEHRGEKKVRVESGAKLPGKALKSGELFAKWKKRTGSGAVAMPRKSAAGGGGGPTQGGREKNELKTPAAVRKERERKSRMGSNRKANAKRGSKR